MVVDFAAERSAHIKGISYDPETTVLTVKFKNGASDTYTGVPSKVFADMTRAPSMGKYFHNVIRVHYKRIAHTNGTK